MVAINTGESPNTANTIERETQQSYTETVHMLHMLMRAIQPLADTFGPATPDLKLSTHPASVPAATLYQLLVMHQAAVRFATGQATFEQARDQVVTAAPRTHKYAVGDRLLWKGGPVEITALAGSTRLTRRPAYDVRTPTGLPFRGVVEDELMEPKPPPDGKQGELSTGGSGHSPKSSANTDEQATVPLPDTPTVHETPPDKGGCDVGGWVFLPPMMAPMRWPGPGGRCIH